MYSIVKSLSVHEATRAAVTFGISLLVAERFFTFHSFSLECMAFAGTWFLFDMLVETLWPKSARRIARRR